MRRRAMVLALLLGSTTAPSLLAASDFARDVKPIITQYCGKCHNTTKRAGDVALDGYSDSASVLKDLETWQKVLENVRGGTMPPQGKPKPTDAETVKLTQWIEETLASAPSPAKIDPGSVTLRRLNRAEYNNTIRDLLATDLKLAEDFSADDSGCGLYN